MPDILLQTLSGLQAAHRALCSAILLGAALLCLTPAFALGAEKPAAALALAQRAIDESNPDLFFQAVDVPGAVGKAADVLLEAMKQEAANADLGDNKIALAFALANVADGAGKNGFLVQLLQSEVRDFVRTGIGSGFLAGKPLDASFKSRGFLSSFLPRMAEGRRELIPGKLISEHGDKAVLRAEYVDPAAGRMPLELGLERREGVWRVVEVMNARELFNDAMQHNKQ